MVLFTRLPLSHKFCLFCACVTILVKIEMSSCRIRKWTSPIPFCLLIATFKTTVICFTARKIEVPILAASQELLAIFRCGLLLQMSWGTVVCVYVCVSVCVLAHGCSHVPKEPCIRWRCTLASPGEYDRMICATAALWDVAIMTVTNCYISREA